MPCRLLYLCMLTSPALCWNCMVYACKRCEQKASPLRLPDCERPKLRFVEKHGSGTSTNRERSIDNFRFPNICSFESFTARDQSLDSWNLDEDTGRGCGQDAAVQAKHDQNMSKTWFIMLQFPPKGDHDGKTTRGPRTIPI